MERKPLRHPILYGEYELSIDDKNRMLVPSDVRKQLDPDEDGEAFFLVFGTDGRLSLYPERHYEVLVNGRLMNPLRLLTSRPTLSADD